MEIPRKDDLIKVTDAVDFIAKHVYPDYSRNKHGRIAARNRVYQHFREAYAKGAFGDARYDRSNEVKAVDLFTWARAQKEWGALTKLNLPCVKYGGAHLAATSTMTASAFAVPATFKEAVTRLMKCEQELAEVNREIRKTQSALDEASGELAEYRRRDKETSAKRSASGKLGKGIKRRRN